MSDPVPGVVCANCDCKVSGNGKNCYNNSSCLGHVSCLDAPNDCPCQVTWDTPVEASKCNKLDSLKWCFDYGKKINLPTLLEAIKAGSQDCVIYIYEEGTVDWAKVIEPQLTAIQCNNIVALTYILTRPNVKLDDTLMDEAAQRKSLPILTALHQKGCPATPTTLRYVCRGDSSSLECITYLCETVNLTPNTNHIIDTILANSTACTDYFITNYPNIQLPSSISSVVEKCTLDTIKYMVAKDIKLESNSVYDSIYYGKLDTFKYLHSINTAFNRVQVEALLDKLHDSREEYYEYYYKNML